MIGFHADVGSLQAALQQTPEILHSVGVNLSIDVRDGVIDHLMGEIFGQSLIRFQRIAVEIRSNFHVLTYQRLEALLAPILDYGGPNLATALQDRCDDCLAFS